MGSEEQQYRLLTIDGDDCPISDNPVIKGQCSGCKYYRGFKMYHCLPSVKCSWFFTSDWDQA